MPHRFIFKALNIVVRFVFAYKNPSETVHRDVEVAG